ncbi:MAG TPA: DMT family transporter [Candidatus Dormibacteraeota bacterium]
MTFAFAFAAAFSFAMGTTLQQRGTLQTPAEASDPRFYVQILSRPAWLLGGVFMIAGGVLHLAALSNGTVVQVEPVLTLSVVIALPLGVWLTSQQVGWREVIGAVTVIVGLVLFLRLSNPQGGVSSPPAQNWITGAGLALVIVVGAMVWARGRSPALVAGLLGTAAGAAFGLAAALDKEFTSQLGHGLGFLLGQWSTYALVVVSIGGAVIQQAALKTGVLAPAIASVNVANLLVSVALGLWVFGETLAHGNGALLGSALGLAVTVIGVVSLTRAHAEEEPVGVPLTSAG